MARNATAGSTGGHSYAFRLGYLLLCFNAIGWGLNFPVLKLGLAYSPPMLFTCLRMALGTLAMFAIAAAQEALAQAGWAPQGSEGQERTASIIASGTGGFPAMVEAVRRCSAHLPTGLLTNNVTPLADQEESRPEVLAVVDLFHVVVESSVVGCRKPEPEFYEVACRRLGVEPSACVFLDDLGINLKPARAMGMATIKVGDPAVAIAELEGVLGIPLG